MPFRYPDKPTRAKPEVLPTLRSGQWLAQLKHDGWRAVLAWDGRVASMVTRTNQPLDPGSGLAHDLQRCCRGLPAGTVLDAEWMGMRRFPTKDPEDWGWRRCRGDELEELVLFDVLAVGGQWCGEVPALERWRALRHIWLKDFRPERPRHIRLVKCRRTRYQTLFEAAAKVPLCEGVVLKHVASRYHGAVDGCFDNPRWLKVKHPAPTMEHGRTRTTRARG